MRYIRTHTKELYRKEWSQFDSWIWIALLFDSSLFTRSERGQKWPLGRYSIEGGVWRQYAWFFIARTWWWYCTKESILLEVIVEVLFQKLTSHSIIGSRWKGANSRTKLFACGANYPNLEPKLGHRREKRMWVTPPACVADCCHHDNSPPQKNPGSGENNPR